MRISEIMFNSLVFFVMIILILGGFGLILAGLGNTDIAEIIAGIAPLGVALFFIRLMKD